jgi:hypothetical protein
MVVMAVITTAMAGPILRKLAPDKDPEPMLMRGDPPRTALPAVASDSKGVL